MQRARDGVAANPFPFAIPAGTIRRLVSTHLVTGASMSSSFLGLPSRRTIGRALAAASLIAGQAVILAPPVGAAESQGPAEIGWIDFNYGGASAVTPTKYTVQHKLWYNDGAWWGVLFNGSGNFDIYKLNKQTQKWTDTNTVAETRDTAHIDVLWTGSELYVAGVTSAGAPTIRSFSYDSGSGDYTLDNTATIAQTGATGSTAVSIVQDGNGTLWAAFMQPLGTTPQTWKANVAHTTTNDHTWSAPYELPGQDDTTGIGPAAGSSDGGDLIQALAYGAGGNASVGVMWSHQPVGGTSSGTHNAFYFSKRADSDSDVTSASWSATPEIAGGLSGPYTADNHFSMTTDENGDLLAVVKTNRNADPSPNGPDPLITVLKRPQASTAWSSHTVFTVSNTLKPTRPFIVVDDTANTANVFYTAPESATSTAKPATIYVKSAPLSSLSFGTSAGTAIIKNSNVDWNLNDVTSTSQHVTSTTGWVALAEDSTTRQYLHACSGAACPVVSSGATYTPVTPARILDTRSGTGLSGVFHSAHARTLQVTGHGGVPSGASAITANLTVTGQTSSGFISVGPIATDTPTTSNLNFPKGDNRANGVTVKLGSGGTLSLTFKGSASTDTTNIVLDVTGYFTDDTSGATYNAVAPARILDTRNGTGLSGQFDTGAPRSFQVTGQGGVPSGAVAVTGNLTVTGQTSAGFVALGPDPVANPTTSTLNFPKGDNRANGVTVKLGSGGVLNATFKGTTGSHTQLVFDVTGYFLNDLSGTTFVPVTPARILDTRNGTGLSGKFQTGTMRTFDVTGQGGVPSTAEAITGNVTVTNQTSSGYVSVGPNVGNSPTTSTLNFPKGENRANNLDVQLNGSGQLTATYKGSTGSTTDLVFDVTGYFLP